MSDPNNANGQWDIEAARNLYNIKRWGAKYFDINDAGHVVARPLGDAGIAVDITDVIEEARGRNLKFPLLIRFQDILRHRVEALNLAFRSSIAEFNYQGKYRGVFPIKVNQLREWWRRSSMPASRSISAWRWAASRSSSPRWRCRATRAASSSATVTRTPSSSAWPSWASSWARRSSWWWRSWRNFARSFRCPSRWRGTAHRHTRAPAGQGRRPLGESGGENAKFGLSTVEILAATEMLKAEKLGHCLKLIHFHIGSQVPDILTVKKAVQEAARFYAKLYKMGFLIEYLDVGGGLGVDYDGSRSAFDSSTNYSLQEYTNDIVYYIAYVCNSEGVPHPAIISESGRAIVAHHSVLIVEVFGPSGRSAPARTCNTARTSTRWSRSCWTSRRT